MTPEDLALCERAAQAVGVKTRRMPRNVTDTGLFVVDDLHGICGASQFFEPLDDDAQAFRIVALLRIEFMFTQVMVFAESGRVSASAMLSKQETMLQCAAHVRRVVVEVAQGIEP